MVRIRVIPAPTGAHGISLPSQATSGAAGADVCAYLPQGDLLLPPQQGISVPTGLILEIPKGYEVQVRARSGLAARHSIGLPNGVGTIDSDYRGEVRILLFNWGTEPYTIRHGERIAQLVVAPVIQAEWIAADSVQEATDRGEGGFGHTGR